MSEETVSQIASAIGEPSRARMLYALMDGHARTSTELAMIAGVSPSTASAHLHRLESEGLVRIFAQGKHRYYSLSGRDTARALEALLVIAGSPRDSFQPSTPQSLRCARTCYDHMAGEAAVALHNRFFELNWLSPEVSSAGSYSLSITGAKALSTFGIDIETLLKLRRRFAYACLDWSERKPHIGGTLGSALLQLAIKRKWGVREYDSRALRITRVGYRELSTHFGIELTPPSTSTYAKAKSVAR